MPIRRRIVRLPVRQIQTAATSKGRSSVPVGHGLKRREVSRCFRSAAIELR